ncbi:MAG: hypothetical protein H8E46_11135, partial [FCB group bacterium]|nr:hypothetical protein [FCB group bacterium]
MFYTLIALLVIASTVSGRTYEPGDWVNYRDFRYVHSGDIGRDHVYFATTGGVTRYHLWQNEWETPLTIPLGTRESVGFKENWTGAYAHAKHCLWAGTVEG